MKAIGYIVVFIALCWGSHYLASSAVDCNIGLALFFGMLIPIIMAFIADISGDM